MDLEFPDPTTPVSDQATAFEDNWLLCPHCLDGWQTNSRAGMVICPNCKHLLHNPRYEEQTLKFE